MIRRILNLYRFTITEQKSLILLCILIMLVNVLNYYLRKEHEIAGYFNDKQIDQPVIISETNPARTRDPEKKEVSHKPPVKKILLEINSADSTAFLTLYGIGPVFAGRIVKFRALLGGYYRCDQLLEVYGMDSLRYLGFSDRIRVDTTKITRININTAGFRELLRHPYLDYETVQKLVQYRDRKGPLSSLELLWRDTVLSEKQRLKIKHYLKSR